MNAPWAFVEIGGQGGELDARKPPGFARSFVTRTRLASGSAVDTQRPCAGEETGSGWTTSYNVGSLEAVERRWRAAIAAKADFIATDQYEAFAAVLNKTVR